jgi:hypothetical protein
MNTVPWADEKAADQQAANEALATRSGRRSRDYTCRCGSGFDTLAQAWMHAATMHIPQLPPLTIERTA